MKTPPLTRSDLIQALQQTFSISAREAALILTELLQTIREALNQGQSVNIEEFGEFKVKHIPPKMVRNPQTGAMFQAPAQRRAVFAAGQPLRKLMGQYMAGRAAASIDPVE
jgi:nucleoid DNA-binding protein